MIRVRNIFIAAALVLSNAGVSLADRGLDAFKPVKQAESRLARAQARLAADNPLAAEMQLANEAVGKAYRRVEKVRREVAKEVGSCPEAKEIDFQVADLNRQLAVTKTPEDRCEIATRILNIRSQRTAMIRDALLGNIPLSIAQADLQEAVNHYRSAEMDFLASINTNPEVQAARENLASARKSMPTIVYAYGG